MRDRRLRRQPPGPGDPPGRAREARVPRLRLGRHLHAGRRTASRPCAPSATWRSCATPSSSATASGGVAVLAPPATTGIGHTRWATHGRVSEENAHPHFDTADRVHVVVNGIVENYMELKQELLAAGAVFTSETDAEVIAHLDLRATSTPAGSRRPSAAPTPGCAATTRSSRSPPTSPASSSRARKECPLVVGRGDGEQFLGSAIPAFLAHTRRVQLIENDEIVVVDRRRRRASRPPTARRSSASVEEVDWSAEVAEKGGYETFMLKEIHEQAEAVAETIADRTARGDGVDLGDLGLDRRRVPAHLPAHRGRRLRHLVPRRPDRPLRDRGVGARRRRDGHRQRVPLPQPGDRPRRPRGRHLAVRRDRRHARRDAPRARARRDRARAHQRHGLAGHARRRRRAVHARRASRSASRRPRPSSPRSSAMYLLGAAHGRAARHARRPSACASWSRALKRIPHCIEELLERRRRRRSSAPRRRHHALRLLPLPRPPRRASRSRSRARSSSRRSPTSRPTPTRPGEMKHGPIALLDERHAGRLRRDRLAGAREGRLEHAGGPRARRARDRRRDRGQRRDRRARRGGPVGAARPTGCSSRCSP